MDLANLLAESDTQINSQQTLLSDKEVNEYRIKWTILSYDNGINVGIFYLEWEGPRKKERSPLKHQNVAAVKIGSNGDDIPQQTIDSLMQPTEIRIPHLRTYRYIVADGTEAAGLYNKLTEEPPMTGKDLSNALMQYRLGAEYHNPNQGWPRKIPDSSMRIALGRGV